MNISISQRGCLFLAAASLAVAQGSISGPLLGYTFDAAGQSLHRIGGIPGSAVIGDSLDLGFPVAKALISPGQDYALVISASGVVNFVKLGKSDVTVQALGSLPPAPDQVVLSANARATAFVYGASIQILTGLPDSLNLAGSLDASALPSAPASVAISDDGQVVLVAARDNPDNSSPGGVFVMTSASGTPRLVAPSGQSTLAFLPDSHDALIVDESANSVTAIQDAGGAAAPQWVFTDDRLGAARLARSSGDGQHLLLASPTHNTLAVVDRNGGNPSFIPCTCSPNEIQPMSGSVYQITDWAGGLIWILDLTSDPRVFFVPTPEAPASSSEAPTDPHGGRRH